MATFNSIFPTFLTDCAGLHTLLLSVAFALFIVGVIVTVSHRFTHRALLNLLMRLLLLTSLLVFLPAWGNALQTLLQNSILSGLGVDPAQVYHQFNQLLVIKRDPTQTSWWNIMSQLHNFTTDIIISALLWLVGQLASLMMFWGYIFQTVIINLGYALSPLLIGFMAIPALKHIGNRYLLNLVGVLLWPLGWAVAALVTQGILDFMTDPTFQYLDPTSTLPDLQKTIGVAAVGFWIIFSTVAAPVIIQHVITSGAQAGSQLLSGGVSSAIQTAATTAGAAATASATGIPFVTASAAGIAALLSTMSSAANMGSAGAIIIAGSGLPPRSARGRPGDDITGNKAVRELIAKSKPNYY
ncbi:MAG: hypothetical protein KGR98_11180 [Verrucomicrobia bacterium]|nr:hypothetical protein [Verrucomicrobiota bacterium]MDE3098781.1 hypothetical protein [Verrucomicrobiota bacterium]